MRRCLAFAASFVFESAKRRLLASWKLGGGLERMYGAKAMRWKRRKL